MRTAHTDSDTDVQGQTERVMAACGCGSLLSTPNIAATLEKAKFKLVFG